MNYDWQNFSSHQPPDGSTTLCYIRVAHQGSHFVIRKSMECGNGYLVVIDGMFDFDADVDIICWCLLDEDEIVPAEYQSLSESS